MDADILIEVGTVIQSNPFEFLEVTRELLESGKATTALLFNPDLDFADPSTLQLDTLGYDLFPQSRKTSFSRRDSPRQSRNVAYRSLMISL